MRRIPALLFSTPVPALLLVAAIATGGGTLTAVKATEKPSFCATCHEMAPYYEAWKTGPHSGVDCVECHIDPGTARYTHKAEALKEVYVHYAGDPKFPQGDTDLPDRRCLTCHDDLPSVTNSGFEHARHASQGTCVECHDGIGHKVTSKALERAGVLAPRQVRSSATTTGPHVDVDCSRCHDLAKTRCETCHAAKHPARGTCTTCHSPGPRWTFAHPDGKSSCTTCHEAPKRHFAGTCSDCHEPKTKFAETVYNHTDSRCSTCHTQPAGHRPTADDCLGCHTKPGESWSFTHPGSAACGSCHGAPAGHYGSKCASCHSPKVAFAKTAYRHTSAACGSCHRRPARHYGGTCSSCHDPKTPFASTRWSHPSSNACGTCHSRPSGHRSGSCESCHTKRGASWAFSHPSSNSCSSCHSARSGHYGSNCAGCHSAGRAWSSASFSHPRVNGEHSYRSFACSKCHPSAPPKVGCTCHGGGTSGPKDEDD